MEGLFLQSVTSAVPLILAGSLLAMVVAAVAYGWLCREDPHAAAEREPLKKAA